MDNGETDPELSPTIPDDPLDSSSARRRASSEGLARGDVVAGYIIGERLGSGGFGEVYAAQHPVIGKQVAIKIIHEQYSDDELAIARFIDEARAVNRIKHPGIVDIFDFGQVPDGRQFCVMERIHGRTLRQVLAARERLPLVEALPILRAIAEAVDAAHGVGVVHRDLKPDNVFVLDPPPDDTTSVSGRGPMVKLIDFGLAKLTDAEAKETSITRTGAMVGTPLYMSPEQCIGRQVDARTDLYSFGALAYHVLTGKPPFSGEVMELALHHIHDAPKVPSLRCPELGPDVDRVLLALLSKDPADRPSPLLAAIRALEGTEKLPPLRRPRTGTSRRIAIGVGAIAVVATVTALVVRRGEHANPVAACEPARDRLAGIWDESTRAAAEARFRAVSRPTVPGTWRVLAADLDRYSTQWGTQWDEACRSPDAQADLLLHAQRLTCLENALLDLRGVSESLARVDVASFADSWNGDLEHAVLDDCATTAVLRAQVPAPALAVRGEVSRLMMELARTRTDIVAISSALEGDTAAKQTQNIDEELARLGEVGRKLEALGAAGANDAANVHVRTVVQLAAGNQPAVRKAVAEAIARAERMRDDTALATAYWWLARVELNLAKSISKAEAALERGEAAAARAGQPVQVRARLLSVRAQIAMNLGHYERAITMMREMALFEQRAGGLSAALATKTGHVANGAVIEPLLRLGRTAEAVTEARQSVDAYVALFGPDHNRTADRRFWLAKTLASAGDHEGAIAEDARLLETLRRIGSNQGRILSAATLQLVHAMQLGRAEVESSARAELARAGKPPQYLAYLPLALGLIELETKLLDGLGRSPPPEIPVVAIHDARAYLSFMLGDFAAMEKHARAVGAPKRKVDVASLAGPTWIFGFKLAPWMLAVADAVAGRRAAAQARLDALAVVRNEPDLAATAIQLDGFVLAALGRWTDARASFEHVRAQPVWTMLVDDWTVAEIDAWLGVARLETGDPAGAVQPLEASLAVLRVCCDGFHYFAPKAELALARALWETGGDKQRARSLAARARDHFVRLGHHEQEREAASRWLDEHKLP
jgi:tRNA A-37 threonylcarbamoyl transferase component Bud32/tetratricopeptide (TPR) repeat protein